MLINNCILKKVFYIKNYLIRYLMKGVDNFNVRFLFLVVLRIKYV